MTIAEYVPEWLPVRTMRRYRRPSPPANWSDVSGPLAEYVQMLAALGLPDPTEATAFFHHALDLRKAGREVSAAPATDAISKRLASGDLAPGSDLTKAIAKQPDPAESAARARRERRALATAAQTAYGRAVYAVHDYGEDAWLALLRPIAEQAAKDKEQERWVAVHTLAAFLRRPQVAGLATAGESRDGVGVERYQFARPDLWHFWRLDRATRNVAISVRRSGPLTFIASTVREGPWPRVTDFDPAWGPGLYSAAECIANAERILAEQDARYTAAIPPEKSRRGAAMFG